MKKTTYLIFTFFLFSCSSIQQDVIQHKRVWISVESVNETDNNPNFFYLAEIKQNLNEFEFQVEQNGITTIYKLPSNKLTLLYEMEMGLKDIQTNNPIHQKIIINTNKTKRTYKVNTDLIANFITGLKKK
jgi:hypothetical protein